MNEANETNAENTRNTSAMNMGGEHDDTARRRERAFALYCHGLRVEAVAATLSLPAALVREWIADLLDREETLSGTGQSGRSAEMLVAIEGYRAIAGAAWLAYEDERAALHALRAAQEAATDATAEEPQRQPRQPANQGARFLAIALTAQREIARLQGLYERHGQEEAPPVHITISERPEGPENIPPG
jgi:hypothetical protein